MLFPFARRWRKEAVTVICEPGMLVERDRHERSSAVKADELVFFPVHLRRELLARFAVRLGSVVALVTTSALWHGQAAPASRSTSARAVPSDAGTKISSMIL